jgi:hypothetical protein
VAVRCEHLAQRRAELAAAGVVAMAMTMRVAVSMPVIVGVPGGFGLGVVSHALCPLCRCRSGTEVVSVCSVRSASVLR